MMTNRRLFGMIFAAAIAVALAGPADAADKQTFLGQHGDWYAYRLNEDGARTCYMVSKPVRSRSKFKKRGDVVTFVTHRPKEGERDVVNFQAGYTYKGKSNVSVKIGDAAFSLFTSKDTAWSRTPADDKAMIAAMIKGTAMVVKGTPSRGTDTTDTYSLRGFTKAYKTITKACGLK
jgi:hypothetical protein